MPSLLIFEKNNIFCHTDKNTLSNETGGKIYEQKNERRITGFGG